MNFITINLDGSEDKIVVAKRTYPRNGFEKMPNGDFVRWVGDPRCITEAEEVAKAEKAVKDAQDEVDRVARMAKYEQEAKERRVVGFQYNTNNAGEVSGPPVKEEVSKTPTHLIKFPHRKPQYNLELFRRAMHWTRSVHTDNPQSINWYNVRVADDLYMGDLPKGRVFAKVQVLPLKNLVKFWEVNDAKEQCDFVAKDILKFHISEQAE